MTVTAVVTVVVVTTKDGDGSVPADGCDLMVTMMVGVMMMMVMVAQRLSLEQLGF